jgi:hypothetical protein
MNLYRVTCKGMRSSHACAYVISDNAQDAYNKLLSFLNKEDLGFFSDRALDKIELIADDERYPSCGTRLFL